MSEEIKYSVFELRIPEPDFDIIFKVAEIRAESIEQMALDAIRSWVSSYLEVSLGESIGLDETRKFENAWENETPLLLEVGAA